MAEDYRDNLIRMLTASSLEETASLALESLHYLVEADTSALLLWDSDLDRYIIGDINTPSQDTAAQFRRLTLTSALSAYQHDAHVARCLEDGLYYEPLNTPDGNHIGAYLYSIPSSTSVPTISSRVGYSELISTASRALWMMIRIEQADREQTQLRDERERLRQLLHAVDQQQQTIDRLLTLERQFSASLEAQVEERTVALQEAQARILHSEKLAVIGQLAGSLAHEINNPLQAIQSGLGLAVAELDSGQVENVRKDLVVIQTELERIQSIFRQMLDFSRPTGTLRERLDLNGICGGVRVLLRKRLEEAKIELCLELEAELPVTCGDSSQIKQVLINLILNSAEAMPPSGGVISVKSERVNKSVHIRIRDTGSGINPAHLPQLFEPFFTTKTRGLGLGLAISREIIAQHQGQITVRSEEGKGTTFTIILPTEGNCDDHQIASVDR